MDSINSCKLAASVSAFSFDRATCHAQAIHHPTPSGRSTPSPCLASLWDVFPSQQMFAFWFICPDEFFLGEEVSRSRRSWTFNYSLVIFGSAGPLSLRGSLLAATTTMQQIIISRPQQLDVAANYKCWPNMTGVVCQKKRNKSLGHGSIEGNIFWGHQLRGNISWKKISILQNMNRYFLGIFFHYPGCENIYFSLN